MHSGTVRSVPSRFSFSTATAAVLCAVLALPNGRVAAQTTEDALAAAVIGGQIGSRVGAAIQAAGEMSREAARATTTIDAARNRYWQAVRTGQGVEAARQDFASALLAKDLHYLMLAIPEGTDGPRATVLNLLSGGMDGGIRPSARPQFERWVTQIRVELGAESQFDRSGSQSRMVIPGPAQLAEALRATGEQQAFYVRARDWAELDASGLELPWDRDARAWVYMILHRYGPVRSTAEIAEDYRAFTELFGESAVLAAAERVRPRPGRPAATLRIRTPSA